MPSTATHYLVTGATRGIGRGLVAALLSRPGAVVVAAVRDTGAPAATALRGLPKHTTARLVVVGLDSAGGATAAQAAAQAARAEGVARLDVVVANAGILEGGGLGASASAPEEVLRHFNVNSVGPLALFQAVWNGSNGGSGAGQPGLLAASTAPVFVGVSTGLSRVGGAAASFGPAYVAYGASKAALNFLVRKIAAENRRLIAFVINPGWVQTDMGGSSAPVTLEQSVAGILAQIDGATKKTSGTFVSFDGSPMEW